MAVQKRVTADKKYRPGPLVRSIAGNRQVLKPRFADKTGGCIKQMAAKYKSG